VRAFAVTFACACALAGPAAAFLDSGSGRPLAVEPRPRMAPIVWRDSVPLGTPSAGRLLRGVRLPAERPAFFTWDPVERRQPNRAWRRWGTDRLVRIVLRIARAYAAAHPHAPRVGIGDLSRPRGGPFGPKHASHQNGLDVDVYYPRLDRRERPPRRVDQIDRRLAQELVDRFVRAGAKVVYVGPATGLTGPPGVVQVLWNHDNHLHARFAAKTD
jgi:murein endopeptidase